MSGGILPCSLIFNDYNTRKSGSNNLCLDSYDILFLFGREVSNGKWSDFGGRPDKNETRFDTALREGYEELNGFLGNEENLYELINNNLIMHISGRYNTYIFNYEYDPNIVLYFNNHHKFIENNLPHKINRNGLFEKSEIKWFSIDELEKNKLIFRGFYTKIIDLILKNIIQIKKNLLNLKMNTKYFHTHIEYPIKKTKKTKKNKIT